MTRLTWLAGILLALTSGTTIAAAAPRWLLDLESGAAFSRYNDIRIPGDTGTDISFTDDLSTDPAAVVRLRLTYRLKEWQHLSLLVAPLRLEATGRVDRAVVFQGVEFPAQTALTGRFRFDSYRLTYRWVFHRREKLRLGIGITGKIRDAAVKLEGGGLSGIKENTGFVPLLNFGLQWTLGRRLGLTVDGDAAAAPQGRAEDVLAALTWDLSPRWTAKAGYRLLEGGADNDEVYSFTWVNYLVVGLMARF